MWDVLLSVGEYHNSVPPCADGLQAVVLAHRNDYVELPFLQAIHPRRTEYSRSHTLLALSMFNLQAKIRKQTRDVLEGKPRHEWVHTTGEPDSGNGS